MQKLVPALLTFFLGLLCSGLLNAQNLFTLSSFTTNDPEVRLSYLGSPLQPGIINLDQDSIHDDVNKLDRGRYPLTRTLVVGAKLKL